MQLRTLAVDRQAAQRGQDSQRKALVAAALSDGRRGVTVTKESETRNCCLKAVTLMKTTQSSRGLLTVAPVDCLRL